MNEIMRLNSEATFEVLNNHRFLRELHNPLREFDNDMIDGPLLEIACGHTSILLDYAKSGRKLIAVDNDSFQLDLLKKRAREISSNTDNWEFLDITFPSGNIPSYNYAAIILSNILHFYSLRECIEIGKRIYDMAVEGTLIYVAVHSDGYYTNDPDDPENNDYFKHYFEASDFEKIFPPIKFECVYSAHIEKAKTKSVIEIVNKWVDKVAASEKNTNQDATNQQKQEYLQGFSEADFKLIFRKPFS